ncbi:MAG: LysR family transcriptional regulator [Prevotella sp.]|jgi:molybdate transport system regulatory protein|nr:LysR family transcriptional regulator [Prevotella sp.]
MHQPFKITAKLQIEKNGSCFLNEKRVELLRRIDSCGSILSASKEMRMSYQQAWTIIKELNAISPLPVVMRQRGGVHGGGAVVSKFGLRLIEQFDKMKRQHNNYLSQMEDDILSCFI